jgi:hypothetical protein
MTNASKRNFDEEWGRFSTFLLDSQRIRPLFVVGPQRSGTTWVQSLLDAHPEISCRFELRLHDGLLQNLHRGIAEYNALIRAQTRSSPAHIPLESRMLDQRQMMLLMRAAFVAHFYGEATSGLRYIGEKTPENLLGISDIALLFPSARYVAVVRDGRDCAISSWHHFRNAGSPDLPLADFIRRWVPERWAPLAEGVQQLLQSHREQTALVRYEDLVSQPKQAMAAVLAALDVDSSPALVDRCVEAAAFETVTGGRKPGQEDPTHFYRSGLRGEWRSRFGEAERAAFSDVGAALNRSLGYAD